MILFYIKIFINIFRLNKTKNINMLAPGIEPGSSPPQGDILTTVLYQQYAPAGN